MAVQPAQAEEQIVIVALVIQDLSYILTVEASAGTPVLLGIGKIILQMFVSLATAVQ